MKPESCCRRQSEREGKVPKEKGAVVERAIEAGFAFDRGARQSEVVIDSTARQSVIKSGVRWGREGRSGTR